MVKHSTHPIILNDLIQLSISDLRKLKLLEKNIHVNRTISWKANDAFSDDQEVASVNLIVNTTYGNNYLQLDYEVNGKPNSYRIEIEHLPSNLGYGNVPYLVCPHSGKRSLKLFLYKGYFVSRNSIENAFYSTQIISKQNRGAASLGKRIKNLQKTINVAQQKHFRSIYDGIPTKKQRDFELAYLRLKRISRGIN